jgi:phosphate-selective porin OprO/OprP
VRSRIAFTAALALCLGVALQGTGAAAGVQDLEIGGRFLQDWIVWGDVDEVLGVASDDATEVRSAYVSAKGKLATHLRFKADYDFAGGEVGVKDVYLEILGIPGVGNARVGHWTVPVGLDLITSTKNLSFLEGGSCTALAPGRNSGLMLWNTFAGGRVTAELGAFKDVDDFAEASGSGEGGSVAGRLTCLVMNADEGKKLLHVAVSGIQSDPRGDVQRFRARPELHLADYLADTGNVPSETATTIGAELAGVFGPAHFQGEYLTASVAALGDSTEDASFSGYYVQGGYFLTGESRGYKGTSFDRTKTKSDFLDEGGLGAWEVVARYSSLDLNDEDAGVLGGKMDDVTVGLNWYMSSNARLMFNYVMATLSDVDGEEVGKESALAARMQFDF